MAIYYGDELLLTGRIEKVERSQSKNLKIEGRSLPAVLIDASMPSPSQYHDVTLATLISDIARPYGLSVENRVENLPTYPQLQGEVDAKIHSFINCCAENDNILLRSTANGNILIDKQKEGDVQATFCAQQGGYLDAQVSFDGSQRFSSLTLLAQSADDLELSYTINDQSMPIYRPLVEKAEAKDLATLQNIAKRRLALTLSQSMSLSLSLNGWYRGMHGKLLQVGDIIQLEDASLNLERPTAFLIESLALSLSNGEWRTALGLVLPNLYSDDPTTGDEPWA
ncbi:hypothetical protein PVA45_08485 (plasmid) [Entomospira entomophila]|uniref:Baseplate hub protein gp44/GpP-like second domain-containing protein n=1 Tax=Entomospira entomophila TaxID=2719988 RepID=A0A968KS96_9SPIO|nr:hypothetical protein [Entomospira entomophilus]NIZ41504.1 hypothetical protein [Entomospira entomophilus]WDI36412.1 hypothetical protein PVA45_08485 [Entomospira entomophilus]